MKRLQNRTLTSILVAWLAWVGLLFPCLLTGEGGAGLFAFGAVAEGAVHLSHGGTSPGRDGHSPGNHHHGGGQVGYCCHDGLVYARDGAQSAGETILSAQVNSLAAWVPLAELPQGVSSPNAFDRSFHFRLFHPTFPDLFLLHSVLRI